MITQDAFTIGNMLIKSIVGNMTGINKRRKQFIINVLLLYLSLRGCHNFSQMSREGSMNEKSYRNQFEEKFDWLKFNVDWIRSNSSGELILGFDPSFICKSGKHSPGMGYFYSGCAGQYKRGMEIGSIAAIDMRQHTAYHLEAIQSPSATRDRIDENTTLVDHYGSLIVERANELQQVSTILVCDAYFSMKKFVDKVHDEAQLEMIGRLRDDANLKYLYTGEQNSGRGKTTKV